MPESNFLVEAAKYGVAFAALSFIIGLFLRNTIMLVVTHEKQITRVEKTCDKWEALAIKAQEHTQEMIYMFRTQQTQIDELKRLLAEHTELLRRRT